MLNGAYFTPSGAGASASYARASSLGAKSSSMVGAITSGAGPLACRRSRMCQYSQLHLYHLYRFSKRKCPFFSFFLLSIKFPFLLLKSTTLKFSQIKVISHCLSICPLIIYSVPPWQVYFFYTVNFSSCLKALCNLGLISLQEKPNICSLKQVQKRCPCPISFLFFSNLKSSQFLHPLVSSNHHLSTTPTLSLCLESLVCILCFGYCVFIAFSLLQERMIL